MIYLSEVRGPQDGCTGLVPFSHMWQGNPRASDDATYGKGSHRRSLAVKQEQMTGHVPIRRLAGEAVVFDTRCWHAAFPNTAGRDRHSLHLRYWYVLT